MPAAATAKIAFLLIARRSGMAQYMPRSEPESDSSRRTSTVKRPSELHAHSTIVPLLLVASVAESSRRMSVLFQVAEVVFSTGAHESFAQTPRSEFHRRHTYRGDKSSTLDDQSKPTANRTQCAPAGQFQAKPGVGIKAVAVSTITRIPTTCHNAPAKIRCARTTRLGLHQVRRSRR
jgi:hypothetical protein